MTLTPTGVLRLWKRRTCVIEVFSSLNHRHQSGTLPPMKAFQPILRFAYSCATLASIWDREDTELADALSSLDSTDRDVGQEQDDIVRVLRSRALLVREKAREFGLTLTES